MGEVNAAFPRKQPQICLGGEDLETGGLPVLGLPQGGLFLCIFSDEVQAIPDNRTGVGIKYQSFCCRDIAHGLGCLLGIGCKP